MKKNMTKFFFLFFAGVSCISDMHKGECSISTQITPKVKGRSFGELVQAYDEGRKEYSP